MLPIPNKFMTTVDLPEGFLTRPEAAKIYNRSQRALERDLEKAMTALDEKRLRHWRLVTKDGEVREALGLSTALVDSLVSEGMVPTWCVDGTFLDETFGKKGMPNPSLKTSSRNVSEEGSRVSDENSSPRGKGTKTEAMITSDVAFLKERIRTLEREKREEAERAERREAKLFSELDVKNKQIAAWDEITQGLTRALATGQLTPRLLTTANESRRETATADTSQSSRQTESLAKIIDAGTATKTEEGSHPKKSVPVRRRKAQPAQKKSSSAPKPATSKKPMPPKWYDMPTIKRFLQRS